MPSNTIYLDTETTGLNRNREDRIVEIAIIDDAGEVLLNTLVNPEQPIPWAASNVHGIEDGDVAHAPTFSELFPTILAIVHNTELVIYNAPFDLSFFHGKYSLKDSYRYAHCAMRQFSARIGEWNEYYGNYRWHRLSKAAEHVGHVWGGNAHRALADTYATRSVWHWLKQPHRITPEECALPQSF